MNRRQIQSKKIELESRLMPLGKRIISLDKEYTELRAQIEKLPGDSQERVELHKIAVEKFVQKQNKQHEFERIMHEHNSLTARQKFNRDNIIENGKKIRDGKADPYNRDIPPAGLYPT